MRSNISIGGSGNWALPAPEQLAPSARKKIFEFEARAAFCHDVLASPRVWELPVAAVPARPRRFLTQSTGVQKGVRDGIGGDVHQLGGHCAELRALGLHAYSITLDVSLTCGRFATLAERQRPCHDGATRT